jgi:uncharacterized protein (DUF1684 family)
MRYLLFFLALPFFGWAQTIDTAFAGEIDRHRQHYREEFLTEARSPLKAADTAFLDFYAPDAAWSFRARFERTPEAKPFDMATYSGVTRLYVQYGLLRFEHAGQPYQLAIYQNVQLAQQEKYRDYLFLPFKDATNGEATYGGGRYLDFRTGDIDSSGILALDFNKAYNPWCAFSDGYNCPIPPRENHLELKVEAGEKLFLGEKKH